MKTVPAGVMVLTGVELAPEEVVSTEVMSVLEKVVSVGVVSMLEEVVSTRAMPVLEEAVSVLEVVLLLVSTCSVLLYKAVGSGKAGKALALPDFSSLTKIFINIM